MKQFMEYIHPDLKLRIDELEYSIKELGFNPEALILIDIIENVDGLTEQTSEVLVDNDSVCKDLLSINAYIEGEV